MKGKFSRKEKLQAKKKPRKCGAFLKLITPKNVINIALTYL